MARTIELAYPFCHQLLPPRWTCSTPGLANLRANGIRDRHAGQPAKNAEAELDALHFRCSALGRHGRGNGYPMTNVLRKSDKLLGTAIRGSSLPSNSKVT